LTGYVTRVSGANADDSQIGRRVTFFVEDNGEGDAAPPDRISDMYLTCFVQWDTRANFRSQKRRRVLSVHWFSGLVGYRAGLSKAFEWLPGK
jgi:hypothetical protein